MVTDLTTGEPGYGHMPALPRTSGRSTLARFAVWFVACCGLSTVPFLSAQSPFSLDSAVILVVTNGAALAVPLAVWLHLHRRYRDFFHPIPLSNLTLLVFHFLFNLYAVNEPELLRERGLNRLAEGQLVSVVQTSFAVSLVGWASCLLGQRLTWPALRRQAARLFRPTSDRSHWLLLALVGCACIVIGVIGNVGYMGGVKAFLAKLPDFYVRPEALDTGTVAGETQYQIMRNCLPVGLLALGMAACLRRGHTGWRALRTLLIFSVPNLFLNSANGGRGSLLQAFTFSVLLFSTYYRPLSFRHFALMTPLLLVVVQAMGFARSATVLYGEYYSLSEAFDPARMLSSAALYCTNFLGTVMLTSEAILFGPTGGTTAWAGLKGLLGGNVLTTQAEIFFRLQGSYRDGNPRYGPPGELFFNYGWLGVVFGMVMFGVLIRVLADLYDAAGARKVPSAGIARVFCAYTAHFLVIANLNYIPAHFTYNSIAFYFVIVAMRMTCW